MQGLESDMDIQLFSNRAACSACGACENVCPKNAITMKPDAYGFLYPHVDETLCIRCGKCRKACSFQREGAGNAPVQVYAAAAKDDEILRRSASGGAFAVFAQKILEQGGAVFGCASSFENGKIHFFHTMIEKAEDLPRLQGSKYVKSNVHLAYRDVLAQLKAGRKVLFSGTPCQVDGLLGFLGGKQYENLITVDIICHGVPSEQFFHDYIADEEKRLGMLISGFDFRSKVKGWGNYFLIKRGKLANGKDVLLSQFARRSSFYWLFLKGASFRENCYSCKYAGKNRVSDLTIGDFWGIGGKHPEDLVGSGLNVEKGVSCVLVNSDRGMHLMDACRDDFAVLESSFEAVAAQNGQLTHLSVRYGSRDEVMELYRQKGYAAVEHWYRRNLGIKYYLYAAWERMPNSWQAGFKHILKEVRAGLSNGLFR